MGERVRVVRDDDGRLLAVKQPVVGGEAAAHAEVALLRRAQMPGVVELLEGGGPAPHVVVTRWVGARSLADLEPPLSPERAAALVLAVSATVAQLHRLGVVHGAVEPTHVLLDGMGRPVLCGFGRAARDGSGLRPAVDVAALGHLLSHLVGGPEAVDRQQLRRGGRGRTTAARRRALLAVAAQATVDDPSCRPSVAALVHGIRRAVPDARLLELPDTDEAPEPMATDRPGADPTTAGSIGDLMRSPIEPADGVTAGPGELDDLERLRQGLSSPEWLDDSERGLIRTWAPVAAAVLAIGATTYVGLSVWRSSSTPAVDAAAPPAARPADSGSPSTRPPTTRPSTSSTTTSTTVSTSATTTAPTTAAAAPVVEHDGRRYQVGEPGDVIAVGPWLCDGRDLVAVLRPATGAIHVFRDWAAQGGSLDATLSTTVSRARSLAPAAEGPGCAGLVVTTASGTTVALTTEELR